MEHDVAVRQGAEKALSFWQPGIWNALDVGLLLTDLEHVSLMCNRHFGEIFEVDATTVVKSGVQELRERVLPLIENEKEWVSNLDDIYADPYGVQRDEISVRQPQNRVERYTGPVLDRQGRPVARLWTFRPVHTEAQHEVIVGELRIDLDSRITMVGETPLSLTRFEFELLNQLAQNRGTAMGREILFRRVWGYDMALNTNSLDVLISRLRKKISAAGPSGLKIETVYAYGYRLTVK